MDREVADAFRPGPNHAKLTLSDDDRLAALEPPLLAHQSDRDGPVQHDHEHVELRVDVFRRPAACAPSEELRVQRSDSAPQIGPAVPSEPAVASSL